MKMLKKVYLFLLLNILFVILSQTSFAAVCNDTCKTLKEIALKERLYEDDIWKALLHVSSSGKSFIDDPKFLLSYGNFSLKNELLKTIESFYKMTNDEDSSICKFPARFLWIKRKLNLSDKDFPYVKCKSLEEYFEKAPADEISLIFSSEDIGNPTTMLGHLSLKFKGKNYLGRTVEHAVSFYTVIDTSNPFKLLEESLFTGMPGLFSLEPFKKQLDNYIYVENRSVWEFKLNLNEFSRKLVYYHVWELKDVKQTYYYTNYNCATVIYYLIALAKPEEFKGKYLFITPKSVIRFAKEHSLIKKEIFYPSLEWQFRMMEYSLESNEKRLVKDIISGNFLLIAKIQNNDRGFLILEFLRSYVSFLYYIENSISEEFYKTIVGLIKEKEKNAQIYSLDLPERAISFSYKGSSQASVGFVFEGEKPYFYFRFMPISHTLLDNVLYSLSKTSLKIGEFALSMDYKYPFHVKLLWLDFYNIESIKPISSFSKKFSYKVRLGIEKHFNKEFERYNALFFSGAIGVSSEISKDVIPYFFLNSCIAYGNDNLYFYISPEVGVMLYELFNMKTLFAYKQVIYNVNYLNNFKILSLKQVLFSDENISIGFNLSYKGYMEKSEKSYILELTYYF